MFPYNSPLCQICHCSLLLRREIDKTCERWVLLGLPHLSFSNHMRHNTCVSSQPNHLINSIIMQVFPLKVGKIQLQSNQLWNHRHAALLRLLRRGNANLQVIPRLKILRWISLFIVFFFQVCILLLLVYLFKQKDWHYIYQTSFTPSYRVKRIKK